MCVYVCLYVCEREEVEVGGLLRVCTSACSNVCNGGRISMEREEGEEQTFTANNFKNVKRLLLTIKHCFIKAINGQLIIFGD